MEKSQLQRLEHTDQQHTIVNYIEVHEKLIKKAIERIAETLDSEVCQLYEITRVFNYKGCLLNISAWTIGSEGGHLPPITSTGGLEG